MSDQIAKGDVTKEREAVIDKQISSIKETPPPVVDEHSFVPGAYFDVQRSGKSEYNAANVVSVKHDNELGKVVLFHFYKCSTKLDEWIPVKSSRIAPLNTMARSKPKSKPKSSKKGKRKLIPAVIEKAKPDVPVKAKMKEEEEPSTSTIMSTTICTTLEEQPNSSNDLTVCSSTAQLEHSRALDDDANATKVEETSKEQGKYDKKDDDADRISRKRDNDFHIPKKSPDKKAKSSTNSLLQNITQCSPSNDPNRIPRKPRPQQVGQQAKSPHQLSEYRHGASHKSPPKPSNLSSTTSIKSPAPARNHVYTGSPTGTASSSRKDKLARTGNETSYSPSRNGTSPRRREHSRSPPRHMRNREDQTLSYGASHGPWVYPPEERRHHYHGYDYQQQRPSHAYNGMTDYRYEGRREYDYYYGGDHGHREHYRSDHHHSNFSSGYEKEYKSDRPSQGYDRVYDRQSYESDRRNDSRYDGRR